MLKEKLDEYLEFDSDLLFNIIPTDSSRVRCKRLVRIFGGAIRDIIANQPIHDIDILVGAKSILAVNEVLESVGYNFIESVYPKDLSSMYSDIHVINEPHTWIKGTKIVQLIRPVVNTMNGSKVDKVFYEQTFIDLIQNVDLSCCGISYDGYDLYQNYPDAILHCQKKIFCVNENAKMCSYSRISRRISKMEERGWVKIKNNISNRRDVNISYILGDDLIDITFKSEVAIKLCGNLIV